MALYEELMSIDVIGPIEQELSSGVLDIGLDSKIRHTLPKVCGVQSPWIEVGKRERNCPLWLGYYLNKYGLISRNCFNCWKVVVRPKTLKELFVLFDLQKEMDLNAKCGIERRPKSGFKGWYAGFWYGPFGEGLEGAKKLHRKVEIKIKEKLGFQTKVILKRACTEMEDMAGPTNDWAYPKGQHKIEDLLDATFDIPITPNFQPGFIRTYTMVKWIRWAFEHGDDTVKEFVDKFPEAFRVTTTVVYHDVLPKIEMEKVDVVKIQGLEKDNGRSDGSGHGVQKTTMGPRPRA